MFSFTPEVSSFDKKKGFWGCLQGFWLTVCCLRLAAQLYRNMEKGNRSACSSFFFPRVRHAISLIQWIEKKEQNWSYDPSCSRITVSCFLNYYNWWPTNSRFVREKGNYLLPEGAIWTSNLGEEMERYCHSDREKLLHIMWEVGILLCVCASSHFSLHIKELLLPTYGCHSSETFLNSIMSLFSWLLWDKYLLAIGI